MRATLAALAVAALPFSALATIDYGVDLTTPGMRKITISAPVKGDTTTFRIPLWRPGSYRVQEYENDLKEIEAEVDGRQVQFDDSGTRSWAINTRGAKRVQISYAIPTAAERFVVHFDGPSSYMYVEGRKEEDTRLRFTVPNGWNVATGLEPGYGTEYVAPDYDVLADNPVTAGLFRYDTYTYEGVPHTIAYYSGPHWRVDRRAVLDAAYKLTAAQSDFFGGLPFKRYVWHFGVYDAADGAGGLEHLSSTRISMATGFGERAISVLSHELFHAWNVKRIRSKVLGPFNYQELPQTGALWWLEGVTDYYADLLMYRYGMYGDDYFHGAMAQNIQRTNADRDRLEVSPYEASYRVRDAANGRGNSAGFGVNYYNTGWVLGLLLDIELRDQTDGRKSLDNVTWDLWEMNKNDQPGFEEGDIRRLLVKHGGDALGDAYDKWVMEPGDLPVNQQLAKVGLVLQTAQEEIADLDATLRATNQGFAVVRNPEDGSIFQEGDIVSSLNGVSLEGMTSGAVRSRINRALGSMKPGQEASATITRSGQRMNIKVMPGTATRNRQMVSELPNASERAKSLRKGWMITRR